jgi:spermidine synthase
MLFFQLCLLGGYAYAHGTTRFLSIRMQAGLHLVLLAIFIVVLPFSIPEGWTPPIDRDPTLWQLSLMSITVGGPFFVLAGSAPMLQRWFSASGHPDADNPYFLYGASNLGSMTSLLAYPVLIEPFMTLTGQAQSWMFGYFGLIGFTVLCGLMVWRCAPLKVTPSTTVKDDTHTVTWAMRRQWLLLAFIPSSLMLGVTTFITTDIASVPLLWILPLALYVGTFIFVFARKPLLSESLLIRIFEIAFVLMIAQKLAMHFGKINPALLIGIHLSVFFFAAMVCHTALAKARPHASHLTEFYLLMSLGGALGGVFNAIIAPQFFIIPIEYGLVLGLCIFMRYAGEPGQSFKASYARLLGLLRVKGLDTVFTLKGMAVVIIVVSGIFAFGLPHKGVFVGAALLISVSLLILSKERWLFGIMAVFILGLFPLGFQWGQRVFKDIVHRDRNFFGVIKVIDTTNHVRMLMHGTTNHGAQALEEKHRLTPLSYYSYESPISDLFEYYDGKPGKQEVGVLGLGIGVTACFQKSGRHFDFYEIDADIADIAENPDYFTYLSDCGSPYDIILGDGRLTIAEKPENSYDVILTDTFSSDNIPIHIITKEALELYLSKLTDGGALIMNISNNYLDLEPVVAAIAQEIGVTSLARISDGGTLEGTDIRYYPAHFIVLTKSEAVLGALREKGWTEGMFRDGVKPWTDQYSNIVRVLGNKIAGKRFHRMNAKEEGEAEE